MDEVWNVYLLCRRKFRSFLNLGLKFSGDLFNVNALFTNTRISVYYVGFRWKILSSENASEQPTPRSFHSETSAKIRNFVLPFSLSLFFRSSSSFSSRNGKNRDRTRDGKGKRRGGKRVVALVRAHNAHFSGTPRIPSLRFPRLAQFPFPFSFLPLFFLSPPPPSFSPHFFSFPGFFAASNEGCSTFRVL